MPKLATANIPPLAPLGTALQDLQIQEPSLEDVYFDLRKG